MKRVWISIARRRKPTPACRRAAAVLNCSPLLRHPLARVAAAVLWLLPAAGANEAAAQIVPFGKNKIQYEDFDWHVLAGEHIDLYFYPEEAELAQIAVREAERAYRELEIKFHYHPSARIPLIIYSSHQHFEQTNVVPGFIPEGVAGFTEFLKGRVAIPFNGSYHDFRRVIQHELVHVFQIRKILHERALHPRGRFPGLPQWFTEGLAEHWSSEWAPEGNLFVGDFVLSGTLPHVRNLSLYNGTFMVYKLGQSLHEFLEREYGDERLVLFFESLWKYKTFENAVRAVYGLSLEELDARWRYDLERRYFPLVERSQPIEVAARPVITEGPASFKPTVVPRPDSLPGRFCFVSPRTGFMNVYCASLSGRDEDVETVLETERTPEFESIHGFTSSLDVNARGELALVAKFGGSDALSVVELESGDIVFQRAFDDLVALSSPSWDPDGEALAFVGLSRSGFSDLYVYRRAQDRLERLTANRYLEENPAWSPEGEWLAFVSDSVPGGDEGFQNLYARSFATGEVRPLTAGRWRDGSPRWSPHGERVLFTSDRSGILNLYEVDLTGNGRRITDFTGGVLDGEPFRFLDGDGTEKEGILFAGFEEGQFRIYRMALPDSSSERIALPARGEAQDWHWAEVLPDSGEAVESVPYRRRFSLDLAQGGGAVGGGANVEAAQALFSDLLGDHLVLFQVFSAAQGGDDFFDSFGGEVAYLNLKQRLNWGGSAYRMKGNFTTIGTLNSPPELFRLSRIGGGGIVSYPFSKFRRLEGRLNVEHNDVLGTGISFEGGRVDREGVIGVASVSFIKDNTLWLPTGPIDGERFNVSLGGTGNISDFGAESFFGILDYRRYFRLGQQSAYAVRGQFLYSDGLIPTRWVLGGSGTLRGYPRYGLRGSRYALINQELRFPVLAGLLLRAPILGNLAFPGVQGALFLDVGNAWEEVEQERFGVPGLLGSYGLGLRMSLGGPLVLRLDFARIFEFDDERELRVFRFDKNRVDFFLGFNY